MVAGPQRPPFAVKKRPAPQKEAPAETAPPRILPHDNFQELIGALCREMDGCAPSSRPRTMVVPSVAFKDHLQTGIARKRGICMGLDLPTAAVFVARVTGKKDDSPWSKESLEWRILPHAREFAVQLGVDAANASTRELFAVSSLLADQLDQYGHFRPEMIRAWDKGQFFLGKDHADEKWQRKLWTELKEEIGEDHLHPAVALAELGQDEEFRTRMRREYPSVTVVGTGTIDPLMVEVLKMLGEAGSEITVHVLVPTQHYLADLKSSAEVLEQLRDEPDSFAHEAGHPLLTSMGRQAAGAFCLLQELDENLPEWRMEEDAAPQAPGSLLNQVQSGIRHLSPPQQTEQKEKHPSIGIHSCFGPRREMEVLRDEILRAFKELPDLQPSEIHIVTPSLDVYAPLVPAALELSVVRGAAAEWTETPLRVRVTEAPRSGHNPLIAAVLALLEMASAESYEASSLLELLHLEQVRRALAIEEDDEKIDRLRARIRDSGVTNGLGGNDGKPGIGTWAFARERLIAGLWMGPEGAPLYPGEDAADRDFVLPVAEDLAGDTALVRSFAAWWSGLETTMREWAEPALPSGWAARLRNVLSVLLGCRDGEELAMRSHLLFLEAVSCDVNVDAGTILDWLDAATSEDRRRNPFSGKIAFGRFRQLQNLPCRVLAMVGMQEGAFPAGSRVPAWDLLQSKPKPWDRNPRIDDRQLFLDAILAPAERLIITGATRIVRTNESEPFSPCVDELLRVVAAAEPTKEPSPNIPCSRSRKSISAKARSCSLPSARQTRRWRAASRRRMVCGVRNHSTTRERRLRPSLRKKRWKSRSVSSRRFGKIRPRPTSKPAEFRCGRMKKTTGISIFPRPVSTICRDGKSRTPSCAKSSRAPVIWKRLKRNCGRTGNCPRACSATAFGRSTRTRPRFWGRVCGPTTARLYRSTASWGWPWATTACLIST